MSVASQTTIAVPSASAGNDPAPRSVTVLHLLKTSVGATWALRQMRELVKLGVRVHVAMPDGPLVPKYRAAGVEVHIVQLDFPVRRPWQVPATLRAMRALVERVKPDLIHSHFVGTTLTMRLALGKRHPTPRLFQVPGPLHLEHPFFRRMELATAGPQDHWMGSCKWTCDCYGGQGVPKDRLWLSYYGVDLEEFRPAEPGKLRLELGVSAGTPIVGMVAFMYAPKRYLGQRRGLKGHEDLIDAIALLAERRPDVRCVMIGGAWNGAVGYESRVREYAKERCGDQIVFLGTRQDVADLYPDLDVVVHPSHSENVGGAAESLLLAVPTIATSVGGFPDLVRNGETGWLVPPKDPAALARAIEDALSDPAEAHRRARRGQELARQVIEVRGTAGTVWTSYQQLLARQHNGNPEAPGVKEEHARTAVSQPTARGFDTLKRVIDVVGAVMGLLVLSPVLLVAAAAIRATMGSPVIFRHERPGYRGRPFTLMKFRTMVPGRSTDGTTDAQRITRLGAILRSTSVDELPQLWNVLMGDMSLVGPRPLRMHYLQMYSPEQARRHEVRPGITGWAQVNGRNTITWQEKFRQDVWYVDHRSLLLDLRILLLTFKKVALREGVSQEGQASVIDFQGNDVAGG